MVVEELLQLLIAEVDAELLKSIVLERENITIGIKNTKYFCQKFNQAFPILNVFCYDFLSYLINRSYAKTLVL